VSRSQKLLFEDLSRFTMMFFPGATLPLYFSIFYLRDKEIERKPNSIYYACVVKFAENLYFIQELSRCRYLVENDIPSSSRIEARVDQNVESRNSVLQLLVLFHVSL